MVIANVPTTTTKTVNKKSLPNNRRFYKTHECLDWRTKNPRGTCTFLMLLFYIEIWLDTNDMTYCNRLEVNPRKSYLLFFLTFPDAVPSSRVQGRSPSWNRIIWPMSTRSMSDFLYGQLLQGKMVARLNGWLSGFDDPPWGREFLIFLWSSLGKEKNIEDSEGEFASETLPMKALQSTVLSMPKCHILGYHFLSSNITELIFGKWYEVAHHYTAFLPFKYNSCKQP